ncbi:16S rRNA (cytidine(1402)-2'-O)-methyltransferase [Terriglobus roseus]|uniref:Ribosomal RNA small subunit methyltransferase I n=1 Tax=Terriglobus roseus TaxID=392734 RepID=A0A1G7FER1_9BACT|nr:16S rRNA (cytidine(1402)-2'-O)-methyltransferase [Terriglobus roseus]SDE74403.1 16S rRNA (cytidine1402-2'-O)-methyltransferase [Terriglobus roseus]
MSNDAPLAPGLYLVATPIGNLEDITLRALRILRSADRIACEDTRQTQKLLNHFGITTPTVSYHLHNERGRSEELVNALREGARIAVVSDAGMPGIADPGEEIVRAAVEANIAVYPVPGANAVLSALTASGLPTEQFAFHGFLPSKAGERRTVLESLRETLKSAEESATQIFYETPHRIAEALVDVEAVFGPQHPIAVARELTKLHEEFLRGTASEVRSTVQSREGIRGEMVLLISGKLLSEQNESSASLAEQVRRLIGNGISEKDALKQVAKELGIGKSEAYREWQRTRGKR